MLYICYLNAICQIGSPVFSLYQSKKYIYNSLLKDSGSDASKSHYPIQSHFPMALNESSTVFDSSKTCM